VGFTLTVYSHALPGCDCEAADVMAALILGGLDEKLERSLNARPATGCALPKSESLIDAASP
jgi:hypothetical protein